MKRLFVTIAALVVSTVTVMALIEGVVRATWDPARGTPGFLIADPVRTERLRPNYDGWFAGAPVHINSLGFRDPREYALAKHPGTFRILILGDSVTFGHGSVYEHTYPYLLEQRLHAWKPRVDWQVWNLGVPGYNTSQELAYLLDVGRRFQPDLVVVGFFGNDFDDNRDLVTPGVRDVAASAVKTWLRRHMYSFDLYKKAVLTGLYRLRASGSERRLLESLAAEDRLVAKPSEIAHLKAQQLTNPVPLSEKEVADAPPCPLPNGGWPMTLDVLKAFVRTPQAQPWKNAVARFQQLHRDGVYHIVFFVNAAPPTCPSTDRFDAKATQEIDQYVLGILSNGTPAVSSYSAFGHYRPSQMPEAAGHSIGNSNVIKADVLFDFLRDGVLRADAF